MAYVKEIHGGTFRRVELSGLLDSAMKLKKQEKESKVRSSLTIRSVCFLSSGVWGQARKVTNIMNFNFQNFSYLAIKWLIYSVAPFHVAILLIFCYSVIFQTYLWYACRYWADMWCVCDVYNYIIVYWNVIKNQI